MPRSAHLFSLVALSVVLPTVRAEELKPTAAENELIALVETLGGKAKLSGELDADSRVAAVFEKADDDTLKKLAKQPNLGALDIRSDDKVTAKGYSLLKELPNLQRLQILAGKFTLEEATAISTIQTLTTLSVSGGKLTDLDVVRFAKLKNLKNLDLMDTPVTDAGVVKLLDLAGLEELNLSGTKVTAAAAKKLLGLEKLKLLQLNNTKVSSEVIGGMEDQLKASKRELKILR
jgi:Leucine-rich repeat (LRR) protein